MTNTKRRGRRMLGAAALATAIATGGLVTLDAPPAEARPKSALLCDISMDVMDFYLERWNETRDRFFLDSMTIEQRWRDRNCGG